MLEFYDRFISRSSGSSKSLMTAFPQGAVFAVSSDRIHKRPREYYAVLLNQVKKERDPIQGYWLEASWYDVFHPEALQSHHAVCEYPLLQDAENTPAYGAMFNAWAPTLRNADIFDTGAARKLSMPDGPSSVGPSSVGPSSGGPSSDKQPPSSGPSLSPPSSYHSNMTLSTIETFANLTQSEPGTIHTGRVTIRFVNESGATVFAESAEAREIIVEVLADANPGLEKSWILIESIEVVSARRLDGNLRRLTQPPQSELKVDYRVFIPLSRTDVSFDASSVDGQGLVDAINMKAQAAGMNVTVSSASHTIVAVETVGQPAESPSGSVRTGGSTFIGLLSSSTMIGFTLKLY